jgi:hypothetical protein
MLRRGMEPPLSRFGRFLLLVDVAASLTSQATGSQTASGRLRTTIPHAEGFAEQLTQALALDREVINS